MAKLTGAPALPPTHCQTQMLKKTPSEPVFRAFLLSLSSFQQQPKGQWHRDGVPPSPSPSPAPAMVLAHPQHKTPRQPVLAFEPYPTARISLQFSLRAPSLTAGKSITAASPRGTAISTHPSIAQPLARPVPGTLRTVIKAKAPYGAFSPGGEGGADEAQLPKLLIPSHRIKAEMFEIIS